MASLEGKVAVVTGAAVASVPLPHAGAEGAAVPCWPGAKACQALAAEIDASGGRAIAVAAMSPMVLCS